MDVGLVFFFFFSIGDWGWNGGEIIVVGEDDFEGREMMEPMRYIIYCAEEVGVRKENEDKRSGVVYVLGGNYDVVSRGWLVAVSSTVCGFLPSLSWRLVGVFSFGLVLSILIGWVVGCNDYVTLSLDWVGERTDRV